MNLENTSFLNTSGYFTSKNESFIFGGNESSIKSEDKDMTAESEETILKFLEKFISHLKIEVENVMIRVEIGQKDSNKMDTFHVRMGGIKIYKPASEDQGDYIERKHIDFSDIAVEYCEEDVECDEDILYLTEKPSRPCIFRGPIGEDENFRIVIKKQRIGDKMVLGLELIVDNCYASMRLSDLFKWLKIKDSLIKYRPKTMNEPKDVPTMIRSKYERRVTEKDFEEILRYQDQLDEEEEEEEEEFYEASTIDKVKKVPLELEIDSVSIEIKSMQSYILLENEFYLNRVTINDPVKVLPYKHINIELQNIHIHHEKDVITPRLDILATIDQIRIDCILPSLDEALWIVLKNIEGCAKINQTDLFTLRIDSFDGFIQSPIRPKPKFLGLTFKQPFSITLQEKIPRRINRSDVVKKSKSKLYKTYEKNMKHCGPFSPILRVFEDKPRIPDILEGEEMESYKGKVRSSSRMLAYLSLDECKITMDEEQLAFIVSLVSTLAFAMAEASPQEVGPMKEEVISLPKEEVGADLFIDLDLQYLNILLIGEKIENLHISSHFHNIRMYYAKGVETSTTSYIGVEIQEIETVETVYGESQKILSKHPIYGEDIVNKPSCTLVIKTLYDTQDHCYSYTMRNNFYGLHFKYYSNFTYIHRLIPFFLVDITFPDADVRFNDQSLIVFQDMIISTILPGSVDEALTLLIGNMELDSRRKVPDQMDLGSTLRFHNMSAYFKYKDKEDSFHMSKSVGHYYTMQGMQQIMGMDYLDIFLVKPQGLQNMISISNHEMKLDLCSEAITILATMVCQIMDIDLDQAPGEFVEINNLLVNEALPVIEEKEPEIRIIDTPIVTWLNSEHKISLVDESYITSDKHDKKRYTTSKEMMDVSDVFEIKDFNISIRLRPRREVGEDFPPFDDLPNAEGIHFSFYGIHLQFITDTVKQVQLKLNIRDIEISDRIKGSSWDLLLCADGRKRKNKRVLNAVISYFNHKNKIPSDPYCTIKTYLEPLKVNIVFNTLEFLILFYNEIKHLQYIRTKSDGVIEAEKKPVFFEYVDVGSVIANIDFKPRRIDVNNLNSGYELVNLIGLEKASINLGSFQTKNVVGWDGLTDTIVNEWKPDFLRALKSAPTAIRGIRHIAMFGTALSDIAIQSFQEYQKGGSLSLAMMSSGANAVTNITRQALELLATFANSTVGGLEMGESLLEGTHEDIKISKYADQPANVTEGFQQGYEALYKSLKDTKNKVFVMPLEQYEKNGVPGLARSALKAVPLAIIKPIKGATRGVAQVLIGFRNTIDQGDKIDSDTKYKREFHPSSL